MVQISNFFESDEGVQLRSELTLMTKNKLYNTKSIYSTQNKDGVSFIDKHMKYMSLYPYLNRQQYVLNLKLMTRIK